MRPETNKKSVTRQSQKPGDTGSPVSYNIILFLYAILPVITPRWGAMDPNSAKFLAFSVVNLLVFCFLAYYNKLKKDPAPWNPFINHPLGILYILFLLVAMLSFTKSVNIPESVIEFSKLFTVFSTTLIISLLLSGNNKGFEQLILIISLILIIDCLFVLTNVMVFISGGIESIKDIKFVYSNKNVLSAVIFVKLPFALWLILHKKGILRFIGITGLLAGFSSVFLLSTRTFYLGLIFLTLSLLIYSFSCYVKTKNKKYLLFVLTYIAGLVITFGISVFIQQSLFPKKNDIYTQDVTERFNTIGTSDHSAGERLAAWKNSFTLIRENPFLGVGTGNWKIAELRLENLISPDYKYMYKNHNDFIEITAETGIIGGLIYSGFFLFTILWFFYRVIWGKMESESKYLLIPGLGLISYGVDAFFNYPLDRPEMQFFFALFIASAITYYRVTWFRGKKIRLFRWHTAVPLILLMGMTLGILVTNFISMRAQRIIQRELMSDDPVTSSDYVIHAFPSIPDINAYGVSIGVIKGRYLIHDGKYLEAINMLKNDKASPYETRREYWLAVAYDSLGDADSALYYYQIAGKEKPLFYYFIYRACKILENKGDYISAQNYLSSYLAKEKGNAQAWSYASVLYSKSGDLQTALAMADSGLRHNQNDSLLNNQRKIIESDLQEGPNKDLIEKGYDFFTKKNYLNAIITYSEVIKKDTGIMKVYEFRALSYYFRSEYHKCLADLNRAIELDPSNGDLYNYRGACYHMLGKDGQACLDFEMAIKSGNADARINYTKYCQNRMK